MGLSSGFTQPDVGPLPPPPLIGALLRVPWETVRQRMLSGLHDRGFTDLVAAHVDVWRYPGPENQRPSELATQTRMTKQALNYLLGQLEELGYLTRETDSNDQRSKRVRLTTRGHAATKAIYEIVSMNEGRLSSASASLVSGPSRGLMCASGAHLSI